MGESKDVTGWADVRGPVTVVQHVESGERTVRLRVGYLLGFHVFSEPVDVKELIGDLDAAQRWAKKGRT